MSEEISEAFDVDIYKNIYEPEMHTLALMNDTQSKPIFPIFFLATKSEMLKVADCINKYFGYESIKKDTTEFYSKKLADINNGRDYLMGVEPAKITPSDALEAFGFGKDGLRQY